jgi:hypothetical protein
MADITEKEFLRQVADLGRLFGWRTYHPWLSIHSERGWPDVAMVRPPCLILASSRPTVARSRPINTNGSTSSVPVRVSRPFSGAHPSSTA